MTELMRRRRALMAQKEQASAQGLVNGSYDGGRLIVTNGNTIAFHNPTIYAISIIPLQTPVVANSSVAIKVSGYISACRYYAVVNGTETRFSKNAPQDGVWLSMSANGTISGIAYERRETDYQRGTAQISLKVDGEVIF